MELRPSPYWLSTLLALRITAGSGLGSRVKIHEISAFYDESNFLNNQQIILKSKYTYEHLLHFYQNNSRRPHN